MNPNWLRATLIICILLACQVGLITAAYSDPDSHGWDSFASGKGTLSYLAAGVLMPLVQHGQDSKQEALRTADVLITSAVLASGLKRIVREERPYEGTPDSFPSGHATAAFTVATMQSHFHPEQALFWYAGATVIAASRVSCGRHYVQDVVAGAALGYYTARLELSRPRGLILSPLIQPFEHSFGLQIAAKF